MNIIGFSILFILKTLWFPTSSYQRKSRLFSNIFPSFLAYLSQKCILHTLCVLNTCSDLVHRHGNTEMFSVSVSEAESGN